MGVEGVADAAASVPLGQGCSDPSIEGGELRISAMRISNRSAGDTLTVGMKVKWPFRDRMQPRIAHFLPCGNASLRLAAETSKHTLFDSKVEENHDV